MKKENYRLPVAKYVFLNTCEVQIVLLSNKMFKNTLYVTKL